MNTNVHDVPLDSLRQRIERLIDLIETGTYGKSDVESLAPELRAALQLPDLSADQQVQASHVLGSLRYSGGLNRPKVTVVFVSDMLGWLTEFGTHLAESVDRANRSLERAQESRDHYRDRADQLLDQRNALQAAQDAVRAFFGVKDA
jgi:hypothetical protein